MDYVGQGWHSFSFQSFYYSDPQASGTETAGTVDPRKRDKAKSAGQTKLAKN